MDYGLFFYFVIIKLQRTTSLLILKKVTKYNHTRSWAILSLYRPIYDQILLKLWLIVLLGLQIILGLEHPCSNSWWYMISRVCLTKNWENKYWDY